MIKKILLMSLFFSTSILKAEGIDEKINEWFQPISDAWGGIVLYPIRFTDEISIPFEYTIDLETSSNTAGDSIIKNSFDFFSDSSKNSKTFTFSTGKMFNLSLQTLLSLNINNEEQII